MDKHKIAVLYPFNTRTRLMVANLVIERMDILSLDEIEILERMVDNTSISIGRAIL